MNGKSNEKLSIYILKILGYGALFTAASILSPTFLYTVLKKYLKYRKYKFKPYRQDQIQNSIKYLKRKKFIAFENNGNLVLTKQGNKRLSKINFEELKIEKRSWDGKWRLLTFDIPEAKMAARHTFRRKLKELGFFHFQRSVFIIPYPCEDEIAFITEFLNIRPYVHLIITNRFPNDKSLLKIFQLS